MSGCLRLNWRRELWPWCYRLGFSIAQEGVLLQSLCEKCEFKAALYNNCIGAKSRLRSLSFILIQSDQSLRPSKRDCASRTLEVPRHPNGAITVENRACLLPPFQIKPNTSTEGKGRRFEGRLATKSFRTPTVQVVTGHH